MLQNYSLLIFKCCKSGILKLPSYPKRQVTKILKNQARSSHDRHQTFHSSSLKHNLNLSRKKQKKKKKNFLNIRQTDRYPNKKS